MITLTGIVTKWTLANMTIKHEVQGGK